MIECKHCGKEFKSKSGLAGHMKFCQAIAKEPTEREVYLQSIIAKSINQVAVQNAKIELGIK